MPPDGQDDHPLPPLTEGDLADLEAAGGDGGSSGTDDAEGGDGSGSGRRRLLIGAAVLVGAVVAGGGGFLIGTRALSADDPVPTATPSATPVEARDVELVRFRDPDEGFEIGYPKGWERLESPDQRVRFVATPNARDSMLVRVVPLAEPVEDDQDVEDLKAVTDALVKDGSVRIFVERRTELNGLPGYIYVYRFRDAEADAQGIHSHYFVFREDRMYILVFQALPADGYEGLAPLFDRIASTFQAFGPEGSPPTESPPAEGEG